MGEDSRSVGDRRAIEDIEQRRHPAGKLGAAVEGSKLNAGGVLQGAAIEGSKLNSNSVLQNIGIQAPKVVGYVVLQYVFTGGNVARAPLTHW